MSRYRSQKSIHTLIIHCADTPNGKLFTAKDIDRWHAERGFRGNPALISLHAPPLKHIGYHFLIYLNGAVAAGRAPRETEAHAKDYNRLSIIYVMGPVGRGGNRR